MVQGVKLNPIVIVSRIIIFLSLLKMKKKKRKKNAVTHNPSIYSSVNIVRNKILIQPYEGHHFRILIYHKCNMNIVKYVQDINITASSHAIFERDAYGFPCSCIRTTKPNHHEGSYKISNIYI